MARQPAKPRKPSTSKPAASTRRTPRPKAAPATPPRAKATPAAQPARTLAPAVDQVKFTLFNFLAQPRAYYVVDRVRLEQPPEDQPEASVAHSVIIIDRSGSMTWALPDLKDTLLKLLTIEEYNSFNLLVTLISYASKGDVITHFERAPIRDIMARDSRYQKEIRRIQTAGLTCISQAFQLAASMVKPGEMTAITLHSDGYANDPSATGESKHLDEVCQRLQGREVFVNTIAYSDYSDFRLLSRVANSVSGTCVKATSIREIYDSINQTSQLLGGSIAPPHEESLSPEYDYQVFLSHQGGKLNGASGPLHVRGLKADDDAVVYKYRKVSKSEYDKLRGVPQAQTSEPVLAFARANLAEGNLNTAKYALASTFDKTLTEKHARALTNLEVAEMAQDIDAVLFQPAILEEHEVLDEVFVNRKTPLLTLIRLLEQHRDAFTINLKTLQKNYRRRGVKRVEGYRDESGNLVKPWLKTEYTDHGDYVPVQSFDINRNTATLNLLVSRPVRLVRADGDRPIKEVAGIKLDRLATFNNYTLVSDGELNVKSLQIRVSQKKLFDELKQAGVLEIDGRPAEKFDPHAEYTLRLDDLPLVPPFEGAVNLDGVFEDLAEVKVLSSILAAHLKEESDVYTPEQVEELKKHYLSKNLYLSFPTTTEYTDLQRALSEGTMDSRVSYKVDIGNHDILNLGKLMSANKFLERMYELTDASGQKVEKPTFEALADGGVTVKHKQLSARTKVTKADEFMKRIFDDFLGVAPNGSVAAILKRAGDDKLAKLLEQKHHGKAVPRGHYVEALAAAKGKLDRYADAIFTEKVSPLVFYIGSTGLLPDEVEARAQSAETLAGKYPNLTFSKDEQDGTFFEVGKTIITVYAKNEYFSVAAPQAAAVTA
jgi:hypothetical protein